MDSAMFPLADKQSLARQRNMPGRYVPVSRQSAPRADILLNNRSRSPQSGYQQAQSGKRNFAVSWTDAQPDRDNKLAHLRPVDMKETIADRRDTPPIKAKDNGPEITRPAPRDNKPTSAPSAKGKGAKAAAAFVSAMTSLFPPPVNSGTRPIYVGSMSIGGKKPEPE